MKKYTVWSYDVWGNKLDGFVVNDRFEIGYIDVNDDDDKTITNALVENGFLQPDVCFGDVIIDDNGSSDVLYINDSKDDYPLFELILEGDIDDDDNDDDNNNDGYNRFYDYQITKSDFDDFDKTPDYYHLPQKIIIDGKQTVLSCGTSDNITVFKFDDGFFVMSENFNLDYVGLQKLDFDVFDDKNRQEVFLQTVSDINDDFFDLDDNKKLDILFDYWY